MEGDFVKQEGEGGGEEGDWRARQRHTQCD